MDENKQLDDNQKNILIGVGVAFIFGLLTLLFTSDKAKTKTKSVVNRQKAKHYVGSKFNGNKKARNVVDNLSDDEINNLLGTADKVKDLESKFSNMTDDLKDYVQDKKKESKKVMNKLKR
ncbi:MAG: hypothetical protein ACTHVM_07610 [Alkalibacterium gilvum]|uniref:Uncharacterized protein n=1 Tax=Alkalibacterium gilvum TaxID=1130080 RepID=A0A1H6T1W3_9LACT|nr:MULTISPECIES: hypothetical protein [Alkalibacterium]MDN6195512.1 hypothetical protein [Atopostipes suicloacalis]MDN6749922.1 hypothetical protein [Staphylococcus equorum]MDN6294521.1 hypothetical protein [Alkalibacterium sp.]MDN6296133.1 hypothetical protein [Alkalibacterium sp.]MDN6385340.1 hypothetical protein [Alkalibacterium sp.]